MKRKAPTDAASAAAAKRLQMCEEDDDIDDDQPVSEVATSETDVGNDVVKKRKPRRQITLTDDQQERFIDWLLEHPQLYDKEHKAYKLTHKKDRLRQEAEELIGAPARF